MRKAMKKAVSLVTMTAILMTAVGCGASSESTGSAASGDSATTESSSQESVIPAEPVEMWWLDRSDEDSQDPVVMAKDEKIAELVKEKFNVILKRERVSATNYSERLNVLIASGDYPDLVSNDGISEKAKAIEAGVLLPLDSILETDEYWKNVDPEILLTDTFNGSVYSLYTLIGLPDGLFYRQDWMENLGLSMPTNVDEMYELLRAFTYDDPDQNGKDDTFGLSISSTFDQAGSLFQMFTAANPVLFSEGCFYYDQETGEVRNVYYDVEDMKAALTWMNKLYNEGILNPEFVVANKKQAEDLFLSGRAGVWPKGVAFVTGRNQKVAEAFPGGKVATLNAIPTKYGTNYDMTAYGSGLCLTNAIGDNVELGKQVLAYLTSPEIVTIYNLGVEGVHYTNNNGTIEWLDEAAKEKYNATAFLSSPHNLELPIEDSLLTASVATADNIERGMKVQATLSETFSQNGADIAKVMQEGITKIIIGEESVDYLDEMIKEFDKLGVPQICDELEAVMNA